MPERIVRESPLARFGLGARAKAAGEGPGVVVAERAMLGHLDLRGDAHDARFAAAVRGVLGVAPPIVANSVTETADCTICWLGPDESLIVVAGDRPAAVERDLRAALAGMRFAVTDVSGGQTVVALHGPHARDVLAKGCPLDLHPRAFDVRRCAQSHLAKAPILLRRVDGDAAFELVVRRSYADYLFLWLEDAAAEYGLEVAP